GLGMGSYALNVQIADSPLQTFWLEGPLASGPISLVAPPPPSTRLEIARQYFVLGFTHILPKGLDHILFVVGIFLLSMRWRAVLRVSGRARDLQHRRRGRSARSDRAGIHGGRLLAAEPANIPAPHRSARIAGYSAQWSLLDVSARAVLKISVRASSTRAWWNVY